MVFPRRRRIARVGPGRYAIRLGAGERLALAALGEQLRDVLTTSTDDPKVRRLFPTAYHEDPDRDLEYQLLTRDELLAGRLASLDVLARLPEVDELDADGASALLRSLNDLRLVLGTILDVSEDEDRFDPDAPDAGLRALYVQLTALLGEVLDALSGGLGDDGGGPGPAGPGSTPSP